MTFVQTFQPNPWYYPRIPGTAVSLADPSIHQRETPENERQFKSSGTSSAADFVDQLQIIVSNTKLIWRTSIKSKIEDVEEDLYVFFPPKKQYNVTIHARYLGRAKPLVFFGDEEFELDEE
jgi:hypothetical protein